MELSLIGVELNKLSKLYRKPKTTWNKKNKSKEKMKNINETSFNSLTF